MSVSMHLSEVEIERFLTARAAPRERQRVVRHLLAGCGVCSRKLVEGAPGRLLDEAEESRRGRASRDSLRNRTVVTALDQEARWRPDDEKLKQSLELLGRSPQSYDSTTLRQIRGLDGPSLVEALLRRSFEMRHRDPKAMLWLAYQAVSTIDSAGAYGPVFHLELRARAWGELANAYRINDGLAEAETALAQARTLLREGKHAPQLQ
jgi:hypothetical protein